MCACKLIKPVCAYTPFIILHNHTLRALIVVYEHVAFILVTRGSTDNYIIKVININNNFPYSNRTIM